MKSLFTVILLSATDSVAVFTVVCVPETVRFPDTTTFAKVTSLVVLTSCGSAKVILLAESLAVAVIPVPPSIVRVSEARVIDVVLVPSETVRVLPDAATCAST